jgi:hypothetical protein
VATVQRQQPMAAAPRPRIPVTAKHIEKAKREDSTGCVIALAIEDAVPGAKSITVDLQTIRWSDPVRRQRYIYLTPVKCMRSLVDFDLGKVIDPFDFSLRNAMVTPMNRKNPNRDDSLERSAPIKRRRPSNTRKLKARDAANPGEVVIEGGNPPPAAAYSSRKGRRTYGAKNLERRPEWEARMEG